MSQQTIVEEPLPLDKETRDRMFKIRMNQCNRKWGRNRTLLKTFKQFSLVFKIFYYMGIEDGINRGVKDKIGGS
jgi:hypothetical protein|tara:strand:- start:2876 stop:3097 length:222 start_codon:yes stop_codon:yes gene_type:complete